VKESKILKTVETNTEVYLQKYLEPKIEIPVISQIPIIEVSPTANRESFGKKKKKGKKSKGFPLAESPEKKEDIQTEQRAPNPPTKAN